LERAPDLAAQLVGALSQLGLKLHCLFGAERHGGHLARRALLAELRCTLHGSARRCTQTLAHALLWRSAAHCFTPPDRRLSIEALLHHDIATRVARILHRQLREAVLEVHADCGFES